MRNLFVLAHFYPIVTIEGYKSERGLGCACGIGISVATPARCILRDEVSRCRV